MLNNLEITNFRGFQSFKIEKLGRLNLLVGQNNSGKTSILEAIQLLTSGSTLEPLSEIMRYRGEYFRENDLELDIQHLFYGHQITLESQFSIIANHNKTPQKLIISINEPSKQLELDFYQEKENIEHSSNTIKNIYLKSHYQYGIDSENVNSFKITENGGIDWRYIRRSKLTARGNSDFLEQKQQFINSSSLTVEKMIELFDKVVLTPQENLILEALQTIQPNIQRVASVNSERYRRSDPRGGFVVRLADQDKRVPIGSMGDGIWRILGLALAMVNAENGFLFIDEIDTGLHFSVMSDMWKLLWETAKKLNVQVFATTHSRDCWESLASIASEKESSEEGILIHRIDPDKGKTIIFTEEEIVVAANRGIEVR